MSLRRNLRRGVVSGETAVGNRHDRKEANGSFIMRIVSCRCLKRRALVIADIDKPQFAEEIQNVTVSVGRDALLACVVDNLRNYKVSGTRTRFFRSLAYSLA